MTGPQILTAAMTGVFRPVNSPLFAPLPTVAGGFACVVVDAPIGFKTWSLKGQGRSPSRHYRALTPAMIMTLPLSAVLAPSAWLFMWWPDPHLPTVLEVMRAWGFKFSGKAFTWIKTLASLARGPRLISTDAIESVLHMGTGFTSRKNSEVVLAWVPWRPKNSLAFGARNHHRPDARTQPQA